ncbi:phosphatase PAP2 family protein [Cytobacillus spongiae]|uniref:phosphatase PAP2 family protein n=1 Tax=Cytobacillus spongiae TaxID=2901381 RepID=UPI001F198517|nr:phosphatase PAP2 family protein [Cytobacillus spongiae]UII56892.1 phosphatase PAP2 family protein [Cytobacillus spongiae]
MKIVAFTSFCVFVFLIYTVTSNTSLVVDEAVARFIQTLFQEKTYPFFKGITFLGSKLMIGAISLFVIAFLWIVRKDYVGVVTFTFAVAIGYEGNMLLKGLIGRQRPSGEHLVHVNSLSFPSGHAMVGLILFSFIAYFIITMVESRLVKWISVTLGAVIIIFIGVSRVVLQVHYPTDVIGGYALGITWTSLWISIQQSLKERLGRVKEKKSP